MKRLHVLMEKFKVQKGACKYGSYFVVHLLSLAVILDIVILQFAQDMVL